MTTFTALHGTDKDFDSFDISCNGSATGVRSSYFFLTSEKGNAQFYGSNVFTCEIESYNPLFVEGSAIRGYSPRTYADKIVMDAFENDEDAPDLIVITDYLDGAEFSTIYVVFDAEQIAIIKKEMGA